MTYHISKRRFWHFKGGICLICLFHSNMKLVMPGLMMTALLASLDQTIVAVALPTIVSDIGGESGYSWVGTAYLLSMLFTTYHLFISPLGFF